MKNKKRLSALTIPAILSFTACILFTAAEARADGCIFPSVAGTNMEVSATKQRALVWLRDGTWEVHIQPVFDREQGGAAWVVPFPSLPEVSESSSELLHQLEIITTPVFIDYCYHTNSGGGGGCGGTMDGANKDQEKSSAKSPVTVWTQGEVGELDYVVLSADDGDNLVTWLETHGYHLPDGSAELIADFETEGQFFFAAQLSEEADPEKAQAPVRFVLPEEDDGFYPLRLTSLAVEGDERLALTLFFAFTEVDGIGFMPQSHPYEEFEGNHPNREIYDQQKEKYFEDNPSDNLLMLFGRNLQNTDALSFSRCAQDQYSYLSFCASYDDLEVEVPERVMEKVQWHDDIMEMETSGAWLYRFEGHLDAEAMSEDLFLGEVASNTLQHKTNIYVNEIGACPSEDEEDEYVGCSFSKHDLPAGWFILTMLLFSGLFVARKIEAHSRRKQS